MEVVVSRVLTGTINEAWELLVQTSTLVYVAEGVMTYDNAENFPPTWVEGAEINLKPRLWGKPQGDHFVRVLKVDPRTCTIITYEYGGHIKSWVHTMHVQRIENGYCMLTDTIDIQAGWRTPIYVAFAHFFYRHRQRRWPGLFTREKVLEA